MTGRNAKELVSEVAALGRVQQNLGSMSDRQLAQLCSDHLWDSFPMASAALCVLAEVTERLFRSQAGARQKNEVMNDLETLPKCPLCRGVMFHRVGFGEADYAKCEVCGCKIPESTEEQR
jgi:formate dehydrogenase maturation protein FdhE